MLNLPIKAVKAVFFLSLFSTLHLQASDQEYGPNQGSLLKLNPVQNLFSLENPTKSTAIERQRQRQSVLSNIIEPVTTAWKEFQSQNDILRKAGKDVEETKLIIERLKAKERENRRNGHLTTIDVYQNEMILLQLSQEHNIVEFLANNPNNLYLYEALYTSQQKRFATEQAKLIDLYDQFIMLTRVKVTKK